MVDVSLVFSKILKLFSKVIEQFYILPILQARLQQYMNRELPDVQAGFRKGRGTRDQIANIFWIMEKAREFQKNIYFCFIAYAKAFADPEPWNRRTAGALHPAFPAEQLRALLPADGCGCFRALRRPASRIRSGRIPRHAP